MFSKSNDKDITCIICQKNWKRGQNAIKCSSCNNMFHTPSKNNRGCSLLTLDEYKYLKNKNNWICHMCTSNDFPFNNLSNNELFFKNNFSLQSVCKLNLIPDEHLQTLIDECTLMDLDNLYNNSVDDIELYNNINSKYYLMQELNKLNCDPLSTLGICHTNIASLSKHIDELRLTLSLIKKQFQIIGITEHKIQKDCDPIVNIDLEGYKPFIFDPTESSHGGTGFFISNSLSHMKRDDLKFNSCGDFESTFLEIIFPHKRNLIVGCIYRHPSSSISITEFNTKFIDPLLSKISTENKLCALVGDFNTDLLKFDSDDNIKEFFNVMMSNYFTPYVMQPTRPISKSLIDNIFINSIDFISYSGNLTIQLSDHLFQIVLLEGFFKDVIPKRINIYERNF